jgi:ethylbenzene dioxygenase beta subunit
MSNALDSKPDYSTYPSIDRAAARAAAQQLLALDGEGPAAPDPVWREVERFYAREARLLDAERFDDWYALLADDLFYWMPLIENRFRRDKRATLSPDHMALFDETKADIAVRIGRLASGLVWTEDPPTRHVYAIGNVEVFTTPVAGEYEVHSTFTQYRNRSEHDQATLIGRRRDILRRDGAGLLIARRLILLPQSILLTKNLSAFF